MRGKWRAWSAVESEKDRERERERQEKEYRHWQEKQEGEETRRGTSRGQTCRKEGRLDRNWQNRGKKEKKQNSKMRRIWTSLQTHTLRSPLIFVFFYVIFLSLLQSPSHSSVSILYVHVLYFPIHASSFFKPFSSPPPCLHIIFQLSPFFSCLKNVFPRLIIPPSCSSVPSLAPPLSRLSPSFSLSSFSSSLSWVIAALFASS